MSDLSVNSGIHEAIDAELVEAEDLPAAMEKRKNWFFECQVRHLNFEAFRGLSDATPDPELDPRLDLFADTLITTGELAKVVRAAGRIHVDSKWLIWTPDERARRDALAGGLIGKVNNWMGFKPGVRLAENLRQERRKLEKSTTASQLETDPKPIRFARKPPWDDRDGLARAVSRSVIAETKPWLIPELYFPGGPDGGFDTIDKWIRNLEKFIHDFETELLVSQGGQPGTPIPGESRVAEDAGEYRQWVRLFLDNSTKTSTAASLAVRMLEDRPNPGGKGSAYQYDIRVATPGYAMGPIDKMPFSDSIKYWTGAFKKSLGECYVNKANADMGLCTIMRAVYLLGTLPATFGSDDDIKWRKRSYSAETFASFFDQRAADEGLKDKPDQQTRLALTRTKLQIILEESAANPRAASPTFSPLVQEIVRQALHSFKFWMDEPFRASSNEKLVRARKETGIADKDNETEQKSEMEYWSENHYIMFASSEYLAGQLWAEDTFQPGKEFLDKDNRTGILIGKMRMERGRARVLKWLNNRLMFGWTEFNSSGYYREHLWALLNLADFSLDREIRDKAALAIDLMLFDVVRFHHKGAIGAAGGRSQFKSKSSGLDNALGDVVDMMLGSRGFFSDENGEIGLAFATTHYKVPEVLLQIGVHPPETPFTDRSRVSITFEEAPKYGIGYSKKSDQKDSLTEGYAPKRARHFPFLDDVNQKIARFHTKYGAEEDDIVFWWGCSAYYNKQVVRGTFRLVEQFGLQESPIFGGFVPELVHVMAALEKIKHGVIGAAIGSLLPGAGILVGGAIGFFADDVFASSLEEPASDDLSFLLEGSTRTRANILTYRTPDVMMSSIQNFRAGQLNFQSSVNQATLNAAVSVFTTAGFEDIDVSDLVTGVGGALVGSWVGETLGGVAALGLATFGAGAAGYGAGAALASEGAASVGLAGGIFGMAANEAWLTREKLLVDHVDGPGWWTGSWALPMVVQHDSAAILVYDFNTFQDYLAECGTHAWFPKDGFNRVEERRTSAYDNADFFLLDITDIGPKGYWLFGKLVHPADAKNLRGEAYIGVFSNQRPEWLNQDSDFYQHIIEDVGKKEIKNKKEEIKDLLDGLESDLGERARKVIDRTVEKAIDDNYKRYIDRNVWLNATKDQLGKETDILVQAHIGTANDVAEKKIDLRNLERIWALPLPQDYFKDRDWYVDSKNVWIIQIGSRVEFGDFETFKDRVSRARIHLDDTGDMECSYDIPRASGGSQRLSMSYEDGGRFGLDGHGFQMDRYPRFENPFVRGGRVEWGQREYVIEYKGKLLLHDFSDFTLPVRKEEFDLSADERNTIRALVIFVRSGDEEMDEFTVATADVTIACVPATRDQVVAVGPTEEETDHDAEWIFFDLPLKRMPDMTLFLKHPSSEKGGKEPHWKMTFSLKALMGDRTLRDCALVFAGFEFEDEKRASPVFPFSVSMSEWRPWEPVTDHKAPGFWTIARAPDTSAHYSDHTDLFALDVDRKLWHRKLGPCDAIGGPWSAIAADPATGGPDLTSPFSAAAALAKTGSLTLFVLSQASLFAAQPSPAGAWTGGWAKLDLHTFPDLILGIPNSGAPPVPVPLGAASSLIVAPSKRSLDGVKVVVQGADGHFYSHPDWRPGDGSPWRKIEVNGISILPGAEFQAVEEMLFALDKNGALWAAAVDHSILHLTPVWEKVTLDGTSVRHFAAVRGVGAWQIVIVTANGGASTGTYVPGGPATWFQRNLPGGASVTSSAVASAQPAAGRAMFFAAGSDARVYSITCNAGGGWSSETAWAPAELDSQTFKPSPDGRLAAITRVIGQVELFAQADDQSLHKAWWS
jgi:hypothetical protein